MGLESAVVSKIVHESYANTIGITPTGAWWQSLESNFHQRPEAFSLDRLNRVKVSITAATDYFLRTSAATMVSALAMPLSARPSKIKQQYRDRHFYEYVGDAKDPALFFKQPPENVPIEYGEPSVFHFKPDDGDCISMGFDSPFTTVNPALSGYYSQFKTNQRARAQYWFHYDGPRPTICAIHGFVADPYWFNSLFFALPWFYRNGFDVLLYTLPFHGSRQEPFSPFSGHGFFAGGASHLAEAVAQSVFDFRIFLDHLIEHRGVTKVGVTGISLGGYVAANIASVEPRLEFALPNVPVVSIPDLIMEWFPVNQLLKSYMFFSGEDIKSARHLMACHCPLNYQPAIAQERLMIVGGVGDRLAPPKQARLLWDHWQRCRIHWFPGSHLLHLDKGDYLKQIVTFLRGIDFLP